MLCCGFSCSNWSPTSDSNCVCTTYPTTWWRVRREQRSVSCGHQVSFSWFMSFKTFIAILFMFSLFCVTFLVLINKIWQQITSDNLFAFSCFKAKTHIQFRVIFCRCEPGRFGDECQYECDDCPSGSCNTERNGCDCDPGMGGVLCNQGTFTDFKPCFFTLHFISVFIELHLIFLFI